MARATYRFEVRAERSDGTWSVVQQSAAVYDSPEEALTQAGVDLALGANYNPVDVVAGEFHGYEVTAAGEPADGYDRGHVEAARKAPKPKVLADLSVIEKAAVVMRDLWMGEVMGAPSLMPDDDQIEPMPPEDVAAEERKGGSRRDADHAARVRETTRRMKGLL